MSALISASELKDKIASGSDIVLLDATYGVPVAYTIAGAHHFDIDAVANLNAPLAHTVPSPEHFVQCVSNMGISNSTEVIVFDQSGFWMAAARVWWMFRLFGHENVKILDGGLQAWDGELAPYSPPRCDKGNFTANFQAHLLKTYADIASNDGEFTLVDARPAQAYDAGAIPHSISISLPLLIAPDARLKSKEELVKILSPSLSETKPLTTTCGSGVTACALALALYECGKRDVAVYDGSWMEWRPR